MCTVLMVKINVSANGQFATVGPEENIGATGYIGDAILRPCISLTGCNSCSAVCAVIDG